jgi:hypothetical protein
VAEWIEDPAQPPAMLIGYLGCWRGTSRNGLGEHRAGIIDYQQRAAGGAANGVRTEARTVASAGGNPERGISDRQLSDDFVSLAYLVEDPGTEGRLIKGDGRSGAIDPQFRLDTCHETAG